MKKLVGIVLLVWCMGSELHAQDAQFSQFYSAPLIINPALTGNTVQSRFSLNYRNQWPAVPNSKAFSSYAFAYDHNFEDYNSAIGGIVFHDRAGQAALQTTKVQVSYAYRVRVTRRFSFKPALQIGVSNRHINFNELVFNDQLQTGASTSAAQQDYLSRSKYNMDMGAGVIGFSDYYWFGIAVHHINRPNISLLDIESRLAPKFSAQGGYNFVVKRDIKKRPVAQIMAAAHYKHQATRDQFDLGAYYNYKPFYMGLWFRGIPLKKVADNLTNNEALIVLIGYKQNGLAIGYSYDLTVSKLTAATSGGAHEISANYEFASRKNQRKRRRRSRFMIPCPKF